MTDPVQAWRVSAFLPVGERPTARLTRETETLEGEPGRFLCLRVLYDGRWWPVMMDSPAELEDHAELLAHARGRVLVHGLGLGCAVSALLADPAVEHVDVVEANADVIALVGPAFDGYPVTIHHGSCVEHAWPQDAWWDYVWHDIWTEVSEDNLDDATAEHGISYGRLAQLFAGRAGRQGAWAFDLVVDQLVPARRALVEDTT